MTPIPPQTAKDATLEAIFITLHMITIMVRDSTMNNFYKVNYFSSIVNHSKV